MICRTCLRRAPGLTARQIIAQPLTRTASRAFSTTLNTRNAAPTAPAAAPAATESTTPDLTPLTPPGADAAKSASLSSCEPGTVLSGLNYFKNQTDPVALADDAYPSWLWRCLEVQKKADDAADAEAGDEFCSFYPPSPLITNVY